MTHQITKMRSGRNVLWLCRGKQWYRWEFHLFLKVLACSKSFVSLSLLSDLSCFKSFSRPWFSSVISSICFAVLPFLFSFSLPLFLSIYFCLILHRYCFKLCFLLVPYYQFHFFSLISLFTTFSDDSTYKVFVSSLLFCKVPLDQVLWKSYLVCCQYNLVTTKHCVEWAFVQRLFFLFLLPAESSFSSLVFFFSFYILNKV